MTVNMQPRVTSKMKAVILTMTSGEGHNHVAKALAEQFQLNDIETQIVDIFAHDGLEYKFNSLGYVFACKYLAKPYDYFWKKLKFRKSSRRYHGTAQREVDKIADDVFEQIEKDNFDFVVSVHPYCAMLCDKWKRQGRLTGKKSFAILTDMLPHPLWESAVQCDFVLTPSEHSFEQLQNKGFKKNQLVACGFPVSNKFSEKKDQTQTRLALGLDDCFTVLVCGGGFGIADNCKIVEQLKNADVQILCVNGHNKKTYRKIQRKTKNNPRIHNYGFVNNMNELMSCADIIVTRAGAGTLFEAMSRHLPMIVREKPIINERENAEILSDAGAAVILKNAKNVFAVVNELQNNPEKRKAMSEACATFAQGGVEKTCETILKLL